MRLRNTSLIFITALAAICIQFRGAIASASKELQLISGSYHNVLVLYDENEAAGQPAKQHASTLMRLWEGFNEASRIVATLTEAVGRRLTFNDVTVLVSAKLGRQLGQLKPEILRVRPRPATWQREDRANFHVMPDLAEEAEGPKWVGRGCGKPATKIQLTDESLDFRQSQKLGSRLALYFSQYRWGVRSEVPTRELVRKVLNTDGTEDFRVASCSQTLQTELQVASGSKKGQRCDLNDTALLNNCTIVVTEPPTSNAASFLFAPYNMGVQRFCESATDTFDHKLVHNMDVKNEFNEHCGRRSAAEVVRKHEDFQQPGSSAAAGASTPSRVRFQVVFEPELRRVVVVMDISTSMQSGSRLPEMIGAVNVYLTNELGSWSECALISFNHKAYDLSNFVKVDSPAARKRLVQSVSSLTASGGTCIGGAVQRAMELLGVDPLRPSRRATGQIILLTDGEEYKTACRAQLQSSISALSNTNLQVHTIRYGDQAEKLISRLSEVTGGKKFFGAAGVSGLGASGLVLALMGTTSDLAGDNKTVILSTQEVNPFFRKPIEFNITASIQRNLAFTLFFSAEPPQAAKLRLMIQSPSGTTFNCTGSSDVISTVDPAAGTVAVRIPDADLEVGRWTLTNVAAIGARRKRHAARNGVLVISGSTGPSVTKAGSHKPFLILRGHVEPDKVQSVTEQSELFVFGAFSKSRYYFNNFNNGRIFAIVSSGNGEVARFDLNPPGGGIDYYRGKIPPYAVKSAREYTVLLKSTFPINWSAIVGTLTVAAENPHFNSLLTPPEEVSTITVTHEVEKKLLLLSWRAIKDQSGLLKPGTPVPSYIVRHSYNRHDLMTNFSACKELAWTNTNSVNIFDKFEAMGKYSIYIAVAAVSAANITGKVFLTEAIDDKITLEDFKKLGYYYPPNVPASTAQPTSEYNSTEALSSGHNSTEALSSGHNSTEKKSSERSAFVGISDLTTCVLAVVTVAVVHIAGVSLL